MKDNRLRTLFLIGCLILFVAGLVRLFTLRFQSGDVYPPYSSMRTDPLGAKAFFLSLKNLSGLTVSRNFTPLFRYKPDRSMTFFFLGSRLYESGFLNKTALSNLYRILHYGGRVVISYKPVSQSDTQIHRSNCQAEKEDKTKDQKQKEKKDNSAAQTQKEKNEAQQDCDLGTLHIFPFSEKWGVAFALHEPEKSFQTAKKTPDADIPGLPDTVSWHSPLYFDKLKGNWKTIYSVNDQPVIIEKAIGSGTLVLSSDSYLFSNEALMKEPRPSLLAWFSGKNRRMVFDDSHFGISKNPGIVGLAGKYGLHGLYFGLAVVALLFAWRSLTPFIPVSGKTGNEEKNVIQIEHDSARGLVSLIRRNIPPKRIVLASIREWQRSNIRKADTSQYKKLTAMAKDLEESKTARENPVKLYHKVSKLLSEGKRNER